MPMIVLAYCKYPRNMQELARTRYKVYVHQFELEFAELVFVKGSRPENLEEKPLGTRTGINNKPSPHVTSGPGVDPRPHWLKASPLTIAPSLILYS